MPKPSQDRLLQRGVWCLVVGVFTSWLLGIGLLFILAAAVCGFAGLFRDRVLQSALLFVSSLVLGGICFVIALHVAAIAGLYAFGNIRSTNLPEKPPVSVVPAKRPKVQ